MCSGGHQPQPVLALEQGLPGSWKEVPGGRYRWRSQHWWSHRSRTREWRSKAGGCRIIPAQWLAQKKSDWAGCDLGRRMMRTASQKLAIIRLVEDSELPVRRPLDEIKVSRTSFYRWYSAYERDGLDGLANQGRVSRRHWNRIPDSVRFLVVEVALDRPELTPRELAWHITDTHDYFVSESSVYRILKAHDLITSPQFTVMRAAGKFQHPTSRVHELWQTDFTYFRVVGWIWYFLSTHHVAPDHDDGGCWCYGYVGRCSEGDRADRGTGEA